MTEDPQTTLVDILEKKSFDEENNTIETDLNNSDKKISVRDSKNLKSIVDIDNNEESLDPKQVQKLIDFVGGDWKKRTPEDLKDEEIERLTRIAIIKASHYKYKPKKHFGIKYKKERQRKNKQAKRQRIINRR